MAIRLMSGAATALLIAACGTGDETQHDEHPADTDHGDHDPGDGDSGSACAPDNGGIDLPEGFCASVFADELGRARHIDVAPNGDVYVAIAPPRGVFEGGSVIALRDADQDGVAEVMETVANVGGNGLDIANGYLYIGRDMEIVRAPLLEDGLGIGELETLVRDLPISGDHTAKTVVVVGDDMYINIGSASNSCQVENRELHSPGIDPCPELCERAGIWKFDAHATNQRLSDGEHVVTGARNTNAMAYDAEHRAMWGIINGRDQLFENWPEHYTMTEDLLLPAEEIIAIESGTDYGWPYCYYDPFMRQKVLAPEYGGDGTIVGRCANMDDPAAVLPAHWAPLGMTFASGMMFPEHYQEGMFATTHGSRFDMQAMFDPGYNVMWVPFENGRPSGEPEHFATGFDGGNIPLPEAATYRPVGIAMMPDGSMIVGDDKVGRVWRITYTPPEL
jgi:glucose/arabinose dehydrogenase